MIRFNTAAGTALAAALLLRAAHSTAADPPRFLPTDFPPSVAVPDRTIKVGDTITVGGPKSANFLPNETMDVFVVPHRIWLENDPLAANAVKRLRIKSDAKGGLPLTNLWKADRAGQFDIVVDYDGNGRFSYALDALSSFVVREK
jgi:hypothetical protein